LREAAAGGFSQHALRERGGDFIGIGLVKYFV